MKKMFLLITFLSFPLFANAEISGNNVQDGYEIVSSNEKYYKTEYFNDNLMFYSNNKVSRTTEISKEEYDLANVSSPNIELHNNISVETEYKKLNVSILKSGSNYRYQGILEWKNMPSTRSYDIFGIAYRPSVYANVSSYQTYYCLKSGGCYTESNYSIKKSSTGIGVSFKLPDKEIRTLKSTLTLDVYKNVDATIIEQYAVGDYAHATKSISLSSSQNYTLDTLGIHLNSSINSYYDEISSASSRINCNW